MLDEASHGLRAPQNCTGPQYLMVSPSTPPSTASSGVVDIGEGGLDARFCGRDAIGCSAEIEQALAHHELIKIKVAAEERETKALIVDAIVRETKASNVQVIGNMLVLYRPSTEDRKIILPR